MPVDVLALELPAHQVRVLGQEQDPPLEHHLIRQLLDATGAQRSEHRAKDYPLPRPEQADFLGGRDPPPPHIAEHPQRRPDRHVAEKESSGIAASRAHPGVLWTHNDSGDDAYVYATDLAGADRGFVRIRGARAVDWEDIALGPCPTRRAACLYIADTGDNEMARKSVVIYAVAEPDPPDRHSGPFRSAPAAALRLKYVGGPDGVEAIYRAPRDSALYLVSKGRRGVIQLYRLPRNAWGGDTLVTAAPLQRLPIPPFARLGRP